MQVWLLTTLLCVGAHPIDTVVVCPRDLQAALTPWIAHRQAQGHTLAVVDRTDSAYKIRSDIRSAAEGGKLRYVLLVGDADPRAHFDERTRRVSTTTYLAKAHVNVRWGSEPEIATDNWYADLDDDQLPDVAIGRLTAYSPRELSVMINKILSYELNPHPGSWRPSC